MPEVMAHDTTTIETDLSRLRPLQIESLDTGDARLPLFNYLLHRYHYLGHQRCVGENLKVMVSDRAGHWMDKYGHPIHVIETFVQR